MTHPKILDRDAGTHRDALSSEVQNLQVGSGAAEDTQLICRNSLYKENASLCVPASLPRRTPRPYQTAAIIELRAALRTHRRVLLQLPTGAGKTFIGATVASGAHAKGKRVVFLVHRAELVAQTSRTFTEEGIPHGILAAGLPTPDALVTVASVQTLARRLATMDAPDLVFVDEAHHAVAGTWGKVLEAWPSAYVIGLSATPERLDGRGLGDVFETMVHGPSTAELIRNGYLSPYRAFAPSTVDLTGVRSRMGDFAAGDAATAMDKPAITGDIVATYQRPAPDLLLVQGRPVTMGLCPGSPDLIGWRSVLITPEMVGQTVAQFLAVEVKAPRGRVSDEQARFLAAVRRAGGLAAVVRSADEAANLMALGAADAR